MKEILPISENFVFSMLFFRKQTTEFIRNRLDILNEYTTKLPIIDREKYINDYKASIFVLEEREKKEKDIEARAIFINYIKELRGLSSDKMIIIHCSDYYEDWVEYSVIGDTLGHNSKSTIKRLYKKDII